MSYWIYIEFKIMYSTTVSLQSIKLNACHVLLILQPYLCICLLKKDYKIQKIYFEWIILHFWLNNATKSKEIRTEIFSLSIRLIWQVLSKHDLVCSLIMVYPSFLNFANERCMENTRKSLYGKKREKCFTIGEMHVKKRSS